MLAKELQAQWHEERNKHLGNSIIRPHSNHKVWWSCDQCPDSLPHIWEATVNQRSRRDGRSGCPFCSGNSICHHNTLARQAPQVAQFWDAKKNHPLSPDHVTVSSGMRVHWKCSVCTYKWQAPVKSKTHGKSGCPKCAKRNSGRKADGTRQKHPTFAKAKHALLEQWDHDRNPENGNFPDNTTLQSQKLTWWRCHECPMGKEHSWQAHPKNRNSHKKASGCPFCVGRKVCDCNSLEAVCPEIAADFDTQRNGVSAAQVTSSTSTKFWWLSDEPGAKKRSVHRRTDRTKRAMRAAKLF
ncbi:TPA: hypothetical protein ACH3X2_002491 [Trebouxia sp. C0005]